MSVAVEKAPRKAVAPRAAKGPTPLQRLETKATAYVDLEDRKRELQAELKDLNGVQEGYRADIMDVLTQHPDVLNGKKSLALDVATLTLRTSSKLVEELDNFSEAGRDAVLKKFKVDAYEVRFNATVVVKAASVSSKLNDALLTVGCEVRDVVSLAVTPAKRTAE